MKIRHLSKSDYTQWRELWDQYLVFYKHQLPEAQTQLTFQRLTDPGHGIYALVMEHEEKVIGFTHSSFTHSTWSQNPEIYLEDLFVDPAYRGMGAATALIEAVAQFGADQGAKRMYWQTLKDNETAQRLYNSLADKTQILIYEKNL
jgi:GNAT superfamily N-acetyltransferase